MSKQDHQMQSKQQKLQDARVPIVLSNHVSAIPSCFRQPKLWASHDTSCRTQRESGKSSMYQMYFLFKLKIHTFFQSVQNSKNFSSRINNQCKQTTHKGSDETPSHANKQWKYWTQAVIKVIEVTVVKSSTGILSHNSCHGTVTTDFTNSPKPPMPCDSLLVKTRDATKPRKICIRPMRISQNKSVRMWI